LRTSRSSNAVHQRKEQRIAIGEVGCSNAAGIHQRDRVLPIGRSRASIEVDWSARNCPNLKICTVVLALNNNLFCDGQKRQKQVNVCTIVCQVADIDIR
jgi:hypothetical protein